MEHTELPSKVGKSATAIWEAYQEVLAELKAKEAAASIVATAGTLKAEAAIQMAETVDVAAISAALDNVAKGLLEAKTQFDEVNSAIEIKKEELDRVHKIQAEADALAAMAEAKTRFVADADEKAKAILAEAKLHAESIRTEAKEYADKLRADAEEANNVSERDRKRAEEAWEYSFKRDKQAKVDEVGDIIAKKLKDLRAREEEVAAREAKAGEIEQAKIDLQTKLDTLEASLQTKIEDASLVAEEKAKKSFGFQKMIIEKDHEGKMAVLAAENKALTERLAEMQTRLAAAEKQVSEAGSRVTEIATASLKAQGDKETISRVAEVAAGAGAKK